MASADTPVTIFTVGGTIDKVYFDKKSDYEVGAPRISGILEEANVTRAYRVEQLMRKDSLDITDDDRRIIRERVAADPGSRILISHGTDTMVDTAAALVGIPGRTIVLTGAIAPALAKKSDANFNAGAAFAAVQILGPGVYIVMNGRILDPLTVRKNRAENRFETIT